MKIDKYKLGLKAKEALGNTLIRSSEEVYKGIINFFTFTPIAFLLQKRFSDEAIVSFNDIFQLFGSLLFWGCLVTLWLLVVLANKLRMVGLEHINEADAKE